MKYFLILFLGLSILSSSCLIAQRTYYKSEPNMDANQAYFPSRYFSIELSTTIGIGQAESTFLFWNNEYALWQNSDQFINLQAGFGAGFMRNSYGKLASVGAPLAILFCTGKDHHFLETGIGGRFQVGFSLAEGFQVVPFFTPSIGYRYQVPGHIYFHSYLMLQMHPSLGTSPVLGIGIGYDY